MSNSFVMTRDELSVYVMDGVQPTISFMSFEINLAPPYASTISQNEYSSCKDIFDGTATVEVGI